MPVVPVMPRVRRVVARRPWIQWAVVAALAAGVAASVADAMAELDARRSAWGSAVTVWVASTDVAVGDQIAARSIEVPAAVRPPTAVDDPAGAVARQAIGRGEIVTRLDVVDADHRPAPADWLVVPARETLPSGAAVGERVRVASDGYVLTDVAIVVDVVDDVTLLAAPPDAAAALAGVTDVVLLRSP